MLKIICLDDFQLVISLVRYFLDFVNFEVAFGKYDVTCEIYQMLAQNWPNMPKPVEVWFYLKYRVNKTRCFQKWRRCEGISDENSNKTHD